MKVWVDKNGGMHYHKAGCKAMQPSENLPHFKYEEIEHQIKHKGSGFPFDYTDIIVDGRRYRPCPFCFGYTRR